MLLPDPPVVREGVVLAYVFVGWGVSAIYDGERSVRISEMGLLDTGIGAEIQFRGRYQDMIPRTYLLHIKKLRQAQEQTAMQLEPIAQQLEIRMGATGEEYGTGIERTAETVKWTEPRHYGPDEPIPLLLQSAYGFPVDWGLLLDLSKASPAIHTPDGLIEIKVTPHAIFDMRQSSVEPESLISVRNPEGIQRFKTKLTNRGTVRVAFFGESTTRSGCWPYLVAQGLREKFPDALIHTSNVAIGGETSLRGVGRLESEVLIVEPDLVFVEYMINDVCTGKPEQVLQTMEHIIQRILTSGAECILVSMNGANPQFTANGSARAFQALQLKLKQLTDKYGAGFVGGYDYFARLHETGKYFITELKGNMINHPWGNVDKEWGSFERKVASQIVKFFSSQILPMALIIDIIFCPI